MSDRFAGHAGAAQADRDAVAPAFVGRQRDLDGLAAAYGAAGGGS